MGDAALWKQFGGMPTSGADLVWKIAEGAKPARTAAQDAAEAERRRLEEESRATALGYRGRSSFLAGATGTLGGV